MPPKRTKKQVIETPPLVIVEEEVTENISPSSPEDKQEEPYYANIIEVTSIIMTIVNKYYSGNKGNYPDFDWSNNKEEYEKMGIYNIYDMARYIVRNRLCDDINLETESGKKVNFKNIKFPPF